MMQFGQELTELWTKQVWCICDSPLVTGGPGLMSEPFPGPEVGFLCDFSSGTCSSLCNITKLVLLITQSVLN